MIDAFHKGWSRLGTEKAVDLSSYVSVDSELVIGNISGFDDWCDDCEGGGSSEEEEGGGGDKRKPLSKFTPAHFLQNY